MARRRLPFMLVLLTVVLMTAQQQGWLASLKQNAVQSQPGLYPVARFIDGDTIAVYMHGRSETIRLIGVDTPETHKPHTPVQCYGPAAAAYTKHFIGNARVRLTSDSLSTNRDRYNRLLRYVYTADGKFLNRELIRQGYGFYYPYFPFTQASNFRAAQAEARSARRGLWGNCQPRPTDSGGFVSNPA